MSSKWYGSISNRIEEGKTYGEIFVGMGATEYMWSDTVPYEVIKVVDEKHVVVRRMDYKRVDKEGMSDYQEYEYTSNPKNYIARLTKTKNGWRARLENGKLSSTTFSLGVMKRYFDYSF